MVKKIRLELINSMTPLITKNIKFKKNDIIFEQNSPRRCTTKILAFFMIYTTI